MASQNATNPWTQCFLSRMLGSGLGDDCVCFSLQIRNRCQDMCTHGYAQVSLVKESSCCLLAQRDLTTITERTPKIYVK